MGAAQSLGVQTPVDLKHKILTNNRIVSQQNLHYLRSSINCDESAYKRWKEEYQKLVGVDTTYLLWPRKEKFNQGGFCTSNGELEIDYDNYSQLLSQEIKNRQGSGSQFTQSQLWYLLNALVIAKHQLKDNHWQLGDIQEGNIFLNSDHQIKVANRYSWPNYHNNFKKAILEDQPSYLAPEDIEKLQLGAINNHMNGESEIFSLGLTLLGSSILKTSYDLYDMKSRQFNHSELQNRILSFVGSKYSPIYKATILNLLEFNTINRVNLSELIQLLKPFQQNILDKKPFAFAHVPQKILNNLSHIRTQPMASNSEQNSSSQLKEKYQSYIKYQSKSPSIPQPKALYQKNRIAQQPHQRGFEDQAKKETLKTTHIMASSSGDTPKKQTLHYFRPQMPINLNYPLQQTKQIPFQQTQAHFISGQHIRERKDIGSIETPVYQQLKYRPFQNIDQITNFQEVKNSSEKRNHEIVKEKTAGKESKQFIYDSKNIEESKVNEVVVDNHSKSAEDLLQSLLLIQTKKHQADEQENKRLREAVSQIRQKQKIAEYNSIIEENKVEVKESEIKNLSNYSIIKPQQHNHSSAEIKPIQYSQIKNENSSKLQSQNLTPLVKIWGSKTAAKVEQKTNEVISQIKPMKNYILIEDQNKNKLKQSMIPQVNQGSIFIPTVNDQSKWSSLYNYHTFIEIQIDASFQQCWEELISMIRNPLAYNSSIRMDKVSHINDNGIDILKIGPGSVQIKINKEEGKILFQNTRDSRCQGEILAGVYKDEDHKHKIWFNSAYTYKDSPFPLEREFATALSNAKYNLERSTKQK